MGVDSTSINNQVLYTKFFTICNFMFIYKIRDIYDKKNKNNGTKLVTMSIEYHLSKYKFFVFEFKITWLILGL